MLPILHPPPSPYPPSGSSQCTSPKHPVSCIEPGLATRFIHDIIYVSMPFSQTSPPAPSPTESIRLIYTPLSFVSFLSSAIGMEAPRGQESFFVFAFSLKNRQVLEAFRDSIHTHTRAHTHTHTHIYIYTYTHIYTHTQSNYLLNECWFCSKSFNSPLSDRLAAKAVLCF